MRRHFNRSSYYVVGEGIIEEPLELFGDPNLIERSEAAKLVRSAPAPFKFGRLFKKAPETRNPFEMIACLTELGARMNNAPPPDTSGEDSNIPSGYTYLGQFIAHEITFDKSEDLFEPKPGSWRSPQIDLDSLYSYGPTDPRSSMLYEADMVRLRTGPTTATKSLNRIFPNDLPRGNDKHAIIGDPRNDENLAVAQTHVAFIAFHNKIARQLKGTCPDSELFFRAKREVVRHFHWIILNDYLPRIIDEEVLDCVLRHKPKLFPVGREFDLFMPLEFSAAAFRLGHSMVRSHYEWNYYNNSKQLGAPTISELFDRTRFSGLLSQNPTLDSEWIIDWRRFYDFVDFNYPRPETPLNFAGKIDPFFKLRLGEIVSYPHHHLTGAHRFITARNLLRGFALLLPCGQDVAKSLREPVMSTEELAIEPFEDLLTSAPLKGNTPLWFYVLREADLIGKGGRLGPVGSRIVAETLVTLIIHSDYSILAKPDWRPMKSNRQSGSSIFEMTDLLDIAEVVDPIRRGAGYS